MTFDIPWSLRYREEYIITTKQMGYTSWTRNNLNNCTMSAHGDKVFLVVNSSQPWVASSLSEES